MAVPHWVFSCAVCRKVRDDHRGGGPEQEWCSLGEFLRRYQAGAEDVLLSEGYCPDCALSYDRLVQYGQARMDAL